jgi:uncharacterized membrane protein YqjE
MSSSEGGFGQPPDNWDRVEPVGRLASEPRREHTRLRIENDTVTVDLADQTTMLGIHAQHSRTRELQIRSLIIQGLASYSFAALVLITAALLILFSPNGREKLTAIIASALVIIALGSYGFGAFSFKTIGFRIEAGQGTAAAENVPRRRWWQFWK